jgi:hypothetical protein
MPRICLSDTFSGKTGQAHKANTFVQVNARAGKKVQSMTDIQTDNSG